MSRYYKPSTYNGHTKEQMWLSATSDFHDSFCKCWHCFAHILDLMFPEGHKDRDLPIRQIIERDLQCHSGGTEEESHGLADIKEEEIPTSAADMVPDDLDDVGIEELIAAADAAAER